MGIIDDIDELCDIVDRHTEHKELVDRVRDWINSPFCPLIDDEELDENDDDD